MKVYDFALSSSDVSVLYEREKSGRNYDGSVRSCQCFLNPIADYHMDECEWNGITGEVIDSSGNNLHGTAINDANITSSGELCKSGKFQADKRTGVEIPSSPTLQLSNKLTYMAWIKLIDPNYSSNSNKLENIFTNQSWANALRYTEKGHWNENRILFQLNIDGTVQYLYSNSQIQDTEWHHISAVYDGNSMKIFIDGELDNSLDVSGVVNIGDLNSRIGKEYDNDDTNDYSFNGYIDELKIFNGAVSDDQILQIYSNEKSGKSYDGELRECPVCYLFDAWDTWRDKDDRNISTKVVNRPFDITIASLSKDGESFQEFNGTVCVELVRGDDSDINYTSWYKMEEFEDGESKSDWRDIKVDRAVKEVKVKIVCAKDINVSCPISEENVSDSAISSDEFAIRPDRFEIDTTAEIYSGEEFNITYSALDGENSYAKDYNETRNSSFEIDVSPVIEGCIDENLSDDSWSFGNGKYIDENEKIIDVGEMNITIREVNGSEFAICDQNDTNDSDRLIEERSVIINVKPYELKILSAKLTPSTGNDEWVYMAKEDDLSNMNVEANVTIRALSKDGNPINDFNITCYKGVNRVQFFYIEDNRDENISYLFDGNLSYSDPSESNVTLQFNAEGFEGGSGEKSYIFGVDRSFSNPQNPLELELKEVNITDDSEAKVVTGIDGVDDNVTFYYGRVAPAYDYSDDGVYERNVTKEIQFLVYSSNGRYVDEDNLTKGTSWYSIDQSDVKEGGVYEAKGYRNTYKNEPEDRVEINIEDEIGRELMLSTEANETFDAWIHLNVSRWLWYGSSEDGFKEYNDSEESSCLEHPCFYYKFNYRSEIEDNLSEGVVSGDFNGSDYDINISKRVIRPRIFR